MILSSGWNERQPLWVKAWVLKRHYLVLNKSIGPSSEMIARYMKHAEEDVNSNVVLGRYKGVSWPGILQGHANGDSR
jgi:hypothetical protein